MEIKLRMYGYLVKVWNSLKQLSMVIFNFILLLSELFAKSFKICIQLIIEIFFKAIKSIKQNIKKFILSFIKILCFVILVLSGLSVTLDYLSYPYIYKLIILDNKYGFDLPAISVCTERHVFFDKHKVIQYFDLQQKYEEFMRIKEQEYEKNFEICFQEWSKIESEDPLYDFMANEIKTTICQTLDLDLNYNKSLFFREYEKKIFESLSFDQMKNLTISANELFKCSAKLHFRYESKHSNATIIENCFKRFDVLESIYGNDFGICYTFFAKNYSIYLKDDDYIQFDIKYETQNKFMINGFYNISIPISERINEYGEYNEPLGVFSDDYFGLYFFVDKKETKLAMNSQKVFKSTRNSLNSELRFRKTSVELLSTPYMEVCIHYGKSIYLSQLIRF